LPQKNSSLKDMLEKAPGGEKQRNPTMYYLHSRGRPRERGIAQGRQIPDKIAWLIEYYRSQFRNEDGTWRDGLSPDARRRKVERIAGPCARLYPEACEEIEGIAAGAGLPFEDVFELNVVVEICASPPFPSCSVYGFADREGRVWLGKSDDLAPAELGANALHHIAPSRALPSLQMHFVGTIWTTSALNQAGFSLGMTGLSGRLVNDDGISVLFLLHALVEQCRTVAEAEEMCSAFEIRSGGAAILMGDASGDIAILEKHVAGQAVRRPAAPGEAIWQTNHCCGASLAGADDPAFAIRPNSRDRMTRIARLDPTVERSFAGLVQLYQNHDTPGGICQHGAGGLHTDSAIITSPAGRTLWATEGYPCAHPFVRHSNIGNGDYR